MKGLSKEEQRQHALINRQANAYLVGYLRDRKLLDPKLSKKQNVFKYFCDNIVGYKHGKKKQRALVEYINKNNRLPLSVNELINSNICTSNKPKTLVNKSPKNFYQSKEWRALRVKVLSSQGRKCCLCGRTPKDGVILHVDHIKPRSKYPELELKLRNLQILCEDCNLGKSNKYEEDWR